MKNTVIACTVLQHELNQAIKETGCTYPTIWVDSGYHKDPNILRTKLQEEIDAIADIDNILLAYGCCGNGTVGLRASTANLIIPRSEDCISIVMNQPNHLFERPKGTYFLTKGWLEGPNSFTKEIEHTFRRYGEQRAKRIFQQMFRNYNYMMLIDTKAYPVEECLGKAGELAECFSLDLIQAQGGIWLLKKLLTGPHDQDFCCVPMGATVSSQDFGLTGREIPRQGI